MVTNLEILENRSWRVLFPEFPDFWNFGNLLSGYEGVLSESVKFFVGKNLRTVWVSHKSILEKIPVNNKIWNMRNCAKTTCHNVWKFWNKSFPRTTVLSEALHGVICECPGLFASFPTVSYRTCTKSGRAGEVSMAPGAVSGWFPWWILCAGIYAPVADTWGLSIYLLRKELAFWSARTRRPITMCRSKKMTYSTFYAAHGWASLLPPCCTSFAASVCHSPTTVFFFASHSEAKRYFFVRVRPLLLTVSHTRSPIVFLTTTVVATNTWGGHIHTCTKAENIPE